MRNVHATHLRNKKLYNITCKTCHGELGQRIRSAGWRAEIVPKIQLTQEKSLVSKAILNHMLHTMPDPMLASEVQLSNKILMYWHMASTPS
jgi:cytochrome c5